MWVQCANQNKGKFTTEKNPYFLLEKAFSRFYNFVRRQQQLESFGFDRASASLVFSLNVI